MWSQGGETFNILLPKQKREKKKKNSNSKVQVNSQDSIVPFKITVIQQFLNPFFLSRSSPLFQLVFCHKVNKHVKMIPKSEVEEYNIEEDCNATKMDEKKDISVWRLGIERIT